MMLARLRTASAKSALKSVLLVAHVIVAWMMLKCITNSPYPVHVIISASMEPTFQRGDLIFLWNRQPLIHAGDIPVVWFEGAPLPMTHRAIKVLWSEDGSSDKARQLILTKGDNNDLDDVALYPRGQEYVLRHQIVGVVKGYIPWLGWITIWLNEVPYLRPALVGLLFIMVLL